VTAPLTGDVPLVRLRGAPFELGRRHGADRAAALRAFLDDDLTRLNRLLPEPVSWSELRPTVTAYAAVIDDAVPALAEEIRGLAAGADIGHHEAVLLQIRREVLGYRKIPGRGDCTTYARASGGPDGGPVLAQTVDLNGDLDDQIAVLDVHPAGSARRALVLSFGGLLGYLGVNSDGLAVGINLVLGGDWRPGVPPYLAIRHVLDTASTVGQAVETLTALPLASSRSIMLCDRETTGYLEVLGDRTRFVAAPESTHTNHFLHPDLAPHDEINVFAGNSSRQRLQACRAALAATPVRAGAEEHFANLVTAPICVPDRGDVRAERTVAAVVALPDRGELHVRPGDPSRSTTRVFRLR
jgi:hypothetical protein